MELSSLLFSCFNFNEHFKNLFLNIEIKMNIIASLLKALLKAKDGSITLTLFTLIFLLVHFF